MTYIPLQQRNGGLPKIGQYVPSKFRIEDTTETLANFGKVGESIAELKSKMTPIPISIPKVSAFEASKIVAEQFRALNPAEKWTEIGGYLKELAQSIPRAITKFGYSAIFEAPHIIKTGEPWEELKVGKVWKFLLGTDKITSYQRDVINNLAYLRVANPDEPYITSVTKASAAPVLNLLTDAWITSGILGKGAKLLERLLPSKKQINNWAIAGYPETKAEGIKNLRD